MASTFLWNLWEHSDEACGYFCQRDSFKKVKQLRTFPQMFLMSSPQLIWPSLLYISSCVQCNYFCLRIFDRTYHTEMDAHQCELGGDLCRQRVEQISFHNGNTCKRFYSSAGWCAFSCCIYEQASYRTRDRHASDLFSLQTWATWTFEIAPGWLAALAKMRHEKFRIRCSHYLLPLLSFPL